MTREEILEELKVIFQKEVFEDDEIDISENTTSDDIEEWDSFEQFNLLTIIEQKYGIAFDTEKAREYSTVKKLIDYILGEIK